MKKWLSIFITAVLPMLLLSGCDKFPVTAEETAPTESAPIELVMGTINSPTEAAVLMGQAVATGENTIISPISINMALAIAANGAAGDTLSAFEAILGGDIDTVNRFNSNLITSTARQTRIANASTVKIANLVLINDSISVKSAFKEAAENTFRAEVQTGAFNNATVSMVNEWVSEKTEHLIDNIIDTLNADDRLVLVNAIYFKGVWRDRFNETATKDDIFTDVNGKTSTVPFMHSAENRYPVYKTDSFDAITMPYADGRYSMVALLPKDNASAPNVSLNLMHTIATESVAEVVNLTFPKFEAEYQTNLKQPLSAMGLGVAFNPNTADFANIADEKLFISDVIHKAKIIVNETGTEAAGATAITIRTTAMVIPTYTLTFNKPFIYYIWDNVEQVPLFMGTVDKL